MVTQQQAIPIKKALTQSQEHLRYGLDHLRRVQTWKQFMDEFLQNVTFLSCTRSQQVLEHNPMEDERNWMEEDRDLQTIV